jgi:hypothetical protein
MKTERQVVTFYFLMMMIYTEQLFMSLICLNVINERLLMMMGIWHKVKDTLPEEGLVVIIQPKGKNYLLEGYYTEENWYNLFHKKIDVEKWKPRPMTCSDVPYSQYFEAIMFIQSIIRKTREERHGD